MTAADYTALKEQLVMHEGLRLFPYPDTKGKLTIGVGRNLTDRGISADEAMDLLENDLMATVGALRHALPWYDRLDPVRQRVLIDMGFNLGIDGLLMFQHMLDACRIGDYDTAANEMLNSRWASQVKGRAGRLARWMRTGTI